MADDHAGTDHTQLAVDFGDGDDEVEEAQAEEEETVAQDDKDKQPSGSDSSDSDGAKSSSSSSSSSTSSSSALETIDLRLVEWMVPAAEGTALHLVKTWKALGCAGRSGLDPDRTGIGCSQVVPWRGVVQTLCAGHRKTAGRR